jgi:hypothetical protein
MPLKLDPRDRKLLLAAGVAFLLLVAGALIFAGGHGSKAEFPTTYSTASGGAKAAYTLLRESGYNTTRWEQPLNELPEVAGGILIIADPQEAPTHLERERLEQFIAGGGQVIATGMFAGTFLPKSSSIPDMLGGMDWKPLPALSPSTITRAAPEIVLASEAYWDSTTPAVPLYGDGEHTRVVKYGYGKGGVIWWGSATPLTNAGLKEHGNLEFFLACVGEGQGRILWDEYIHGYRKTLTGSVVHSPVMWMFLQLGLLGFTVLATFSRRNGPIFALVSQSRLSPLEFVHTLGGLYQRAGAASVAVDVAYQRFRYWLTRRLGMANNVAIEDLEAALRERLNFSDELLVTTFRECESARYNPSLPADQALRLIRKMDEYAVELKLFRGSRKENA